MDAIFHTGLTFGLLVVADWVGFKVDGDVSLAAVAGGVFLDADKVVEIISNRRKAKKGEIPDITARCRILHSVLAFLYGGTLSLLVFSAVPFVAVLLHIGGDSFIPGLLKNGKNYPSHSRRKWLANPFSSESWAKVTIGWPVTYPPELSWVHTKLGPVIGIALLSCSFSYSLYFF